MKNSKLFTVLLATLVAVTAFAFAACGNDDKGDNGGTTVTEYTVTFDTAGGARLTPKK